MRQLSLVLWKSFADFILTMCLSPFSMTSRLITVAILLVVGHEPHAERFIDAVHGNKDM